MIDKKMHKEGMGCFEMYLDEVDAMAKNDPMLLKLCGWTYDSVIDYIKQIKSLVKDYLESLDEELQPNQYD